MNGFEAKTRAKIQRRRRGFCGDGRERPLRCNDGRARGDRNQAAQARAKGTAPGFLCECHLNGIEARDFLGLLDIWGRMSESERRRIVCGEAYE